RQPSGTAPQDTARPTPRIAADTGCRPRTIARTNRSHAARAARPTMGRTDHQRPTVHSILSWGAFTLDSSRSRATAFAGAIYVRGVKRRGPIIPSVADESHHCGYFLVSQNVQKRRHALRTR